MASKSNCCEFKTMCGYSLHRGVKFVGIASTVISVITLAHALSCVINTLWKDDTINERPEDAVNLIFGLFSSSVSLYQIVVSLLLIWQAVRTKGDMFLCTLWHASHVVIVILYTFMFTAKVIIFYLSKNYWKTGVIAVFGLLYNSIFIYFAVIINSFSNALEDIIYY